ncbi:MAG: MBL fold metallo-hydrolase [Anaerolineae bacterium]|nr:MBL fold metallo-hydrolase [Anaerolineae bacterium]
MSNFICVTCGTQFPASEAPPAHCPICEDERQYVGFSGQQWTTLDALKQAHANEFVTVLPGVTAIRSLPKIGIGQRAFLVESSGGNVLWDCITLLDDTTIDFIREHGGIRAMAISHPHYYSTMIEWSRTFDVPIYIHEAERQYVERMDDAIDFWEGETLPLWDDITLIRCGGHYEGGQVLHCPAGASGAGVLLTGDIIQVVPDRRYVSFMYSYPNLIPLPASKVRHIVDALEPYSFDQLYNAFDGGNITTDAKNAVRRSAERYIAAITE